MPTAMSGPLRSSPSYPNNNSAWRLTNRTTPDASIRTHAAGDLRRTRAPRLPHRLAPFELWVRTLVQSSRQLTLRGSGITGNEVSRFDSFATRARRT
jgi:hypothetical protein